MKKCELCEKEESKSRHHLIPKGICKKINPNTKIKGLTVGLCNKCHSDIHYAFIDHIIMSKKVDGYNRLDAVRFQALKSFMKSKYIGVYKDWKQYWRKFLEDVVKEMQEPDEEIIERDKSMKCEHEWKNDEMFESGAVMMLAGPIGEVESEMRQTCNKCRTVRYIPKTELNKEMKE